MAVAAEVEAAAKTYLVAEEEAAVAVGVVAEETAAAQELAAAVVSLSTL